MSQGIRIKNAAGITTLEATDAITRVVHEFIIPLDSIGSIPLDLSGITDYVITSTFATGGLGTIFGMPHEISYSAGILSWVFPISDTGNTALAAGPTLVQVIAYG
jgi:hypothetical protein